MKDWLWPPRDENTAQIRKPERSTQACVGRLVPSIKTFGGVGVNPPGKRSQEMRWLTAKAMILVSILMCCMPAVAADTVSAAGNNFPSTASSDPFLLGPPKETVPVVVSARFDLYDIYLIDEETETFAFTGILTLKWNDPRQAFDPAAVGVNEKVFQGDYQFNELSPGWYPQVVLVNAAGSYETDGVVLRVQADGTSTLVETLSATAKTEFNMRRYPFDRHRLEALFEVLGFDREEIVLQVESDAVGSLDSGAWMPEWTIAAVAGSVRDRSAPYAGVRGVSSTFVVSVDVQRKPFYSTRLIIIPLIVIVLLSFSVFWMDKSSLGDRTSVSFIGILTGVTYQIVVSDQLPKIAYFTLVHGFLNLSFFTMCATVVINLVVGALDQRRETVLADRIDYRCRWAFPAAYFGLMFVMVWVALVFF